MNLSGPLTGMSTSGAHSVWQAEPAWLQRPHGNALSRCGEDSSWATAPLPVLGNADLDFEPARTMDCGCGLAVHDQDSNQNQSGPWQTGGQQPLRYRDMHSNQLQFGPWPPGNQHPSGPHQQWNHRQLPNNPAMGVPGIHFASDAHIDIGHGSTAVKTKVCRYVLSRANNHFGRSCNYVHPCRKLLIDGACMHGRRCTDDHVCRSFVFYGNSSPHGCQLGDACTMVHVKQESDRAALIGMYRDWIAVRHQEGLTTQALGSASVAATVVQAEVMLAAASNVAMPSVRIFCPFWYTDTLAGCKAGPDCVYDHAGQFQLPTRPMPSESQARFAERAWEKRVAAVSPKALSRSQADTPRSMSGCGSDTTGSQITLKTTSPHCVSGYEVGNQSLSPLSLEERSFQGSGLEPAVKQNNVQRQASQAADLSTLLNPSPYIAHALQMAATVSRPPGVPSPQRRHGTTRHTHQHNGFTSEDTRRPNYGIPYDVDNTFR